MNFGVVDRRYEFRLGVLQNAPNVGTLIQKSYLHSAATEFSPPVIPNQHWTLCIFCPGDRDWAMPLQLFGVRHGVRHRDRCLPTAEYLIVSDRKIETPVLQNSLFR